MPSFQEIYASHADRYEQLVAHEDYQGNILPALAAIYPLAGATIVEAGAGTGRLTRLLAPRARQIVACDAAPAMLRVAAAQLRADRVSGWQLAVADNRSLPVASGSADLAVAGWSFGHATEWFADQWQAQIGQALDEFARTLRPGGAAVILETLGTGRNTPAPPSPALAAFYEWLEQERGFTASWIRTDFRFASAAQAAELTGFFFGTPAAGTLTADGALIVPECTGIWWKRME